MAHKLADHLPLAMQQDQLDAFADLAEQVVRHAGALREGIEGLVKETIRARVHVVSVIGPTAKRVGKSPLADAAQSALTETRLANEQVLFLASKVDAMVQLHRQAMDALSHVSNELSLIEEEGRVLLPQETAMVGAFGRTHQFATAEWKLDVGIAVIQLHAVLHAYHRLLLAFSGKRPGRRWNAKAAGKEVADKAHDIAEDLLTFPGYSKVKKVIKALRTPPALKQAEELIKAQGQDGKVHTLNRGLAQLDLIIAHADRVISESGKALIAASDSLDDASAALLQALRKKRGG